jgi:hypothetical protein
VDQKNQRHGLFKKPKFEDHMLKNGKYDSKINLLIFFFFLRKSIILEVLNTAQFQLFQAWIEKKISSIKSEVPA